MLNIATFHLPSPASCSYSVLFGSLSIALRTQKDDFSDSEKFYGRFAESLPIYSITPGSPGGSTFARGKHTRPWSFVWSCPGIGFETAAGLRVLSFNQYSLKIISNICKKNNEDVLLQHTLGIIPTYIHLKLITYIPLFIFNKAVIARLLNKMKWGLSRSR